ncbi:hypothetical protein F8M41_014656 [Gigaspora margarita]|uniref:Uncharacterized protein n=1 Tax=Gigaspora margarita TaxID=4874 RepID=A0A8H3WYH8_GIGMA|nr:hypothetical protein F8M41_014656 [Gigaspora margarita]
MVFQFILPDSFDHLTEDYEFANQPLFGESLTTDNILIIFETTLNYMLENYENDFEMEDVHSEIAKQIPIGCNILPLKIVILKPGDPLSCNSNVHAVYEMYCDDLFYSYDRTPNNLCEVIFEDHSKKFFC